MLIELNIDIPLASSLTFCLFQNKFQDNVADRTDEDLIRAATEQDGFDIHGFLSGKITKTW